MPDQRPVRPNVRALVAVAVIGAAPFALAQSTPTLAQHLEATKACAKRECIYRAGRDLQITITGIGAANAGVVFERSNYEGDYYASMGMAHGCVIVHNGKAKPAFSELAFISPVTGKVHTSWQECQVKK